MADQEKVVSAMLNVSVVVVDMEVGMDVKSFMLYKIYIASNVIEAALSAFQVLVLSAFENLFVNGEMVLVRDIELSSAFLFGAMVAYAVRSREHKSPLLKS